MTNYLNYVLETNAALCIFLVVYLLLLKNETDFQLKRIFLLVGILSSLLFPLLHLENNNQFIPSLKEALPVVWLPEVVIGGEVSSESFNHSNNIKFYIGILYAIGILFFFVLFFIQLFKLSVLIKNSKTYTLGKFEIAETTENKPTFSFFRFILIGQAHKLSPEEKIQIIKHEGVHAQQLHSFDVLLMRVLSIFFWFNPVLIMYKKIFVQLHEFEADARAVQNDDVNDYCSLMARVALMSADINIANYFNNSLTLKRIEMIRSVKSKIKGWKLVACATILPLVFFIVSCQDQVIEDVTEIAKNSSNALVVPEHIQARYEAVQKENPSSKYLLLELNDAAQDKLAELERTYGLPKSMEVFKVGEQNTVEEEFTGKSEAGITIRASKEKPKEDFQTFAILQYTNEAKQLSGRAKTDDVFTVVEESATPTEGLDKFYEYIGANMQYPKQAREKGLEGRVMIEFIVQIDGSLSDFKVLKGVDPSMNDEAIRVIQQGPKWNPGKQSGAAVKQKIVLPINFSLGTQGKKVKSFGFLPVSLRPKTEGDC